jgi:organic hydroperoxide reductase OsmC/OhrA
MTAVKREATIRWLGNPPESEPRLSVGSHSIAPLLSLNVDPEATDPLATLPGELLAGAIGSVFTWLVAERLLKEGTQARELMSYVTLTLSGEAVDATDAALSGITCRVSGRVAGVEETHLEVVARAAMTECIQRLGMRTEGIDVAVEASLEGSGS